MMLKSVRRPMGGFFVAAALMAGAAAPPAAPVEPRAQVMGNVRVETSPGPNARSAKLLSRSEVNKQYWRSYGRYAGAPRDTSNASTCEPGAFNAADVQVQTRALNFMRRLNGLGPVKASEAANERAQAAALVMAANRRLSHTIDPSWACWSNQAQHGAATSNLAVAFSPLDTAAWVQLYMDDPGDNNYAVGHRRWLMFPALSEVGFGSVTAPNGATGSAITVLEVKRRRTASNPEWTAWPARGAFPAPLSTSRWSLSSGNDFAKFDRARVRVIDVKTGQRVALTQREVHGGYGKPTLVWDMGSFDKTSTFEVRVRNVRVEGKRVSHAYRVKMFTPWAIS